MKSIIKQILCAVLLISMINDSQCRWYILKYRLSHLINRISDLKEGDFRETKLYNSFDIGCGKNFLKVPQSDKMLVNEEEDLVFNVAASLKCSDEDKAFKYYFDEINRPNLKKWLKCFELYLQQHEPDSKLIENVIISYAEKEKCKEQNPIDEVKEIENGLEDVIGPLDVFSCGAVTSVDDYIKFVTKGALIKFGDSSEAVKKAEMEKLKEYLKDIAFTTADCIFKRFDKDPKAFLINDTLTSYFNRFINPVEFKDDPELHTSTEVLKKVIKNIDLNCIKEQLNLAENGDLTLLEVEVRILLGSAISKCIKTSQYDFTNLLLDYGFDEDAKSEENIYCAKYYLQNLEPNSKIAKISVINPDIENRCEYYPIISVYPFTSTIRRYEDSVGEFEATTCGVISQDFIRILANKALLIAVEQDKELKKMEIEELFATVKTKLSKFADCVLQRLIK